jgi:hypothetical protein
MPDLDNIEFVFQLYLTVNDAQARPLSDEWGEYESVAAVNIFNPTFKLEDNSENNVDILTGDNNSQYELIAPGGSSGIVGAEKLSDYWIRSRNAGEGTTLRIFAKVYKYRDE